MLSGVELAHCRTAPSQSESQQLRYGAAASSVSHIALSRVLLLSERSVM